MAFIHYDACPACSNGNISRQLSAIDYTVSKQAFEIWECKNCTLRFTQDVPDKDAIGDYYKSENYISHTDTRQGVVNGLYHLVRKKTLSGKHTLIQKKTGLTKGRLLDIGAGTGAFSSFMQQQGWQVTALEPDVTARERALAIYNLKIQDSEALWQLGKAGYDAITMWHVLEHVHNLNGYLDKISGLLSETGKAFIAVPNYTSYDAEKYGEYWAAYDVPRHLYHFSPASLKMLLNKHALRLHSIAPMWFDSFYVSMLSEKYRSGSEQYVAAFFRGLLSNSKALKDKEKCSSLIYIIEKPA